MKREIEGCGGVSLREHIEKAQSLTADAHRIAREACDVAEECCDEQSARLNEIEIRLAAIKEQPDD